MGVLDILRRDNRHDNEQEINPFLPQNDTIHPSPMVSTEQFNYYLQIQDFTEEMKHIKGMLEGKIIVGWTKDGSVWDYPKKIIRYFEVANQDTEDVILLKNKKGENIGYYVLEERLDLKKHMPTGRTYEVSIPIVKPFCNPEGQAYIFNWFSARLQKGTPNSDYSIDRIFYLLRSDVRELQRTIYTKRKDWDIDFLEAIAFIGTIMDRVEACRRRALEGKEFEKTSTQTNVSITGGLPIQKPGGFSLLQSLPRTRY